MNEVSKILKIMAMDLDYFYLLIKNVTFNTLIHQADTQVIVDVSQTHVQYSPR